MNIRLKFIAQYAHESMRNMQTCWVVVFEETFPFAKCRNHGSGGLSSDFSGAL